MRFRLLSILVVLGLGFAFEAQAQRAPYDVTVDQRAYQSLQTGMTHTFTAYGAFPANREGSVVLNLPFTFNFFGTDYTQVTAYTNGLVSFESLQGPVGILSAASTVPNPNDAVSGYIAAVWQDLEFVPGNSELRTATLGQPGDRTFVIEYVDFSRVMQPNTTKVNFRIELDEADFTFRVWFGRIIGVSQGTTAAEDGTGIDGLNLLAQTTGCTGTCPCAPRTCSVFGNWTQGRRITAELPPGPELYGQFEGPPGERAGQFFDARLVLDNGGLSDAGATTYRMYLGTAEDDLSGAVELGDGAVPPMSATSSVALTATFQVPPTQPVGRYFLILEVDADGDVTEANEGNNLYSLPFSTGPDLTGQVLTVPTRSGAGEALPVQVRVRSDGAPVFAAVADFYLSRDDGIDGSDTFLGQRTLSMADGFETTVTETFTVPTSVVPGIDRKVIVRLDPANAVVELDEGNNTLLSEFIEFTPPNLNIINLAPLTSFPRGESVTVTVAIRNEGGALASGFTTCVYLSAASTPSTQDLILETDPLTLPGLSVATLRLEPQVPASTSLGSLNLAIQVDCRNQVQESNENDNSRTERVQVIRAGPDFAPELLALAPEAQAGEPLAVTLRIENQGVIAQVPEVDLELLTAGDSTVVPISLPDTLVQSRSEITLSADAMLPKALPSGIYQARVQVSVADDVNPDNDVHPVQTAFPQVQVDGFDLVVEAREPSRAAVGLPYLHTFIALGADPSQRVWDLLWLDAEPDGLTFSQGVLAGTPTAVGSYPFRLGVQSGGLELQFDGTLAVDATAPRLAVVDRVLPPAVAGASYRHQISIVGGQPPYDVTSPDLVSFWTLSRTGLVTGVPPSPTAFMVTLEVRDSVGAQTTALVAMEVLDPDASLEITLPAMPSGLVGRPYDVTIPVEGGEAPYRFELEGTLPAGLAFDGERGRITGTPQQAGVAALVVEVRDDSGLFDRDPYVLEIVEAGTLFIPAARLPEGFLERAYSENNGDPVEFEIEGMAPEQPVTWQVGSGALPPGLSLVGPRIEGTPTQAGVYAFEIVAFDDRGDVARQFQAIRVRDLSEGDRSSGGGCGALPPSGAALWALGVLGVGRAARRRRREVER